MPKVLVIVVTFNAMHWIDRCLGSLKSSSLKPDVLVIDNCSLDGTDGYVDENFTSVRLIRNEENVGFGAANNQGFRIALDEGYDYVYLLNQDAWLHEDTLEKMVAAFEKTRRYAVLSPVQTDANGKLDAQFSKKCRKYLKKGEFIDEVPFVMAAHWLISRKALLTVGGFSPAFDLYGEDDNWIDRAHFFGLKAGVVGNAEAVHDRADRGKAPWGADREVRKACKDAARMRRLRLKCISTVVKLCNPCHSFAARLIVEPLELLGMSVKNLSSVPAKYIPQLLGRRSELRRLRKESKNPGAFLD